MNHVKFIALALILSNCQATDYGPYSSLPTTEGEGESEGERLDAGADGTIAIDAGSCEDLRRYIVERTWEGTLCLNACMTEVVHPRCGVEPPLGLTLSLAEAGNTWEAQDEWLTSSLRLALLPQESIDVHFEGTLMCQPHRCSSADDCRVSASQDAAIMATVAPPEAPTIMQFLSATFESVSAETHSPNVIEGTIGTAVHCPETDDPQVTSYNFSVERAN